MLWSRFPTLPWSEFSRLDRLHDQVNRLFDRYGNTASPRYPLMNLWADDEKVILTAELPGIEAQSLDITVNGRTLTVKGRRDGETVDDEKYQRRERATGEFGRSFELPYDVEADSVQANYRNGVLTLELPRQEASKPRKISVNG